MFALYCIVFQHVMTSCVIQLQRCRTELDGALPAPLRSLAHWLQRVEAVLAEDHGTSDHASAARNASDKQEQLKVYKVWQFSYFSRVNY